jgi:hypothetical protein
MPAIIRAWGNLRGEIWRGGIHPHGCGSGSFIPGVVHRPDGDSVDAIRQGNAWLPVHFHQGNAAGDVLGQTAPLYNTAVPTIIAGRS